MEKTTVLQKEYKLYTRKMNLSAVLVRTERSVALIGTLTHRQSKHTVINQLNSIM